MHLQTSAHKKGSGLYRIPLIKSFVSFTLPGDQLYSPRYAFLTLSLFMSSLASPDSVTFPVSIT